MLKIKEHDVNGNKIDLKELEKYGFKYFKNGNYEAYEIDNWNSWLCVEAKNRILQIGVQDYTDIEDNVIYDLIKADLVEKVSDEE